GDAGVARDAADVERIDAEHLGDDRGEHVVGALADLGRAAEHGDLAAAIDQQLHARLRHLVPVDRQPRATEIGTAGQANALSVRQLAEALLPVGALDHRADALLEADRADL